MDLKGVGRILNGLIAPSKVICVGDEEIDQCDQVISMQEKVQIIIDDSEEFRKLKEELRATKMVTSFGINEILANSIDKRLERSDHGRRGSHASTRSAPEKAVQNELAMMDNQPRRASSSLLLDNSLSSKLFKRNLKQHKGSAESSSVSRVKAAAEKDTAQLQGAVKAQPRRRSSNLILDAISFGGKSTGNSVPDDNEKLSPSRKPMTRTFSLDVLQKLMTNLEEETNRRNSYVKRPSKNQSRRTSFNRFLSRGIKNTEILV